MTRSVGTELSLDVDVDVDVKEVPLSAGAVYLFCTDGLTKALSDENIAWILLQYSGNLEGAVSALIQGAKDAGGTDDITVVLAQVVEEPAA